MNNFQYFTQRSIDKIKIISNIMRAKGNYLSNNNYLDNFANNMAAAFGKEIAMEPLVPNMIFLKNTLKDFDKTINGVSNSKYQSDIDLMTDCVSFCIKVNSGKINVHILSPDMNQDINLIAALLHSINTFCTFIPYDYDGLTIYASLDHNYRDLNNQYSAHNLDKIYQDLKIKSAAFTVSGVTNRYMKKIILTKKEEIIKLLFHELSHYACLDNELVSKPKKYIWSIKNQELNLSESYAEFISVLMHSCYISMHISTKNNYKELFYNILENEQQYSNMLSAKIIDFFNNNPKKFFSGTGEKVHCPICIFEYVLLRSVLLNKIDKVFDILKDNLKLSNSTANSISDILLIDQQFINTLDNIIISSKQLNNISYLLFDIDWTKF